MTSRSHAIKQRAVASGKKRVEVMLSPQAVAALRELRARGAVSDAAALNAAVVAHEEATR